MSTHAARYCIIVVIVAAAALCAGCEQPQDLRTDDGNMAWWDQSKSDALRHDLQVYQNNFENQVEDTATKILDNSTARGIRLAALTWKTRLLDRLEEKVREPNAVIALLDTWALAVRQQRFFTTGEGKRMFGDQQPAAVTTATQLLTEIEKIGDEYIPVDHREDLKEQIKDYADAHPFIGVFDEPQPTSLSTDKNALNAFGDILALPLAPFASAEKFGKGVQDFNVTASRFTDTLSDLPSETRWQLEVLLLNLDTNPAVKSLLDSLNRVSQSSEAYADIARTLPKELEGVLDTTVDRTATEASPLIDQAARRIAELLLLAFGLATLLVVIIRLTRPRRKRAEQAS